MAKQQFPALDGEAACLFGAVACVVEIVVEILQLFGIIPSLSEILGFGPTHIDVQRQAIKHYFTPIFKRMHDKFGWPNHKYTFLAYKSYQVKERLELRPELATLQGIFDDQLEALRSGFGMGTLDTGERQRIARQYIANAVSSGWSFDQVLQCWTSVLVAEYRHRGLTPPPGLLPPAPPYLPYDQWTRPMIEVFTFLKHDGFSTDSATYFVNHGTWLLWTYQASTNRDFLTPQWPQPQTGQSWNGTSWYVTSDHPQVVQIDTFLYGFGSQITPESWAAAQTAGPGALVTVFPPYYAAEVVPPPPIVTQTTYWKCVNGVCQTTSQVGYMTLAACQAACTPTPAPAPTPCAAECQSQIDVLKSGLAFLKDFVLNSVWPGVQAAQNVANQALDKARQAMDCCTAQQNSLAQLRSYVYQTLTPLAQEAHNLAQQANDALYATNQNVKWLIDQVNNVLRPGMQQALDRANQALDKAKQALDKANQAQDRITNSIQPQITNLTNVFWKFATNQSAINTYFNTYLNNLAILVNNITYNITKIVLNIVLTNCEKVRACLDQGIGNNAKRACAEGKRWWGIWAECWLQTHTPKPAEFLEFPAEQLYSRTALVHILRGELRNSQGEVHNRITLGVHKALFLAGQSQLDPNIPGAQYDPGAHYVFADVSKELA